MGMTVTVKCFITISLTSLMATAMPIYADAAYTVTKGKSLDSNSYQGYGVYRQWCARCHGTFGQGSPKAPDLADNLNTLTPEEFREVVSSGKLSFAQKPVSYDRMPAWKHNANVMENVDNIYSYLKARSDGAIGAVRPQLGQ